MTAFEMTMHVLQLAFLVAFFIYFFVDVWRCRGYRQVHKEVCWLLAPIGVLLVLVDLPKIIALFVVGYCFVKIQKNSVAPDGMFDDRNDAEE